MTQVSNDLFSQNKTYGDPEWRCWPGSPLEQPILISGGSPTRFHSGLILSKSCNLDLHMVRRKWRHIPMLVTSPIQTTTIFYSLLTCTCAPPLWKRFRHPCLSLWRDIITLSFKCWFSIRLGCTQQKTGQVHVEGLVEKMEAVANRSPKENVWSYSFQQEHPRLLGYDCLSIQFMYTSGRQHFLQNRPSASTLLENLPLPMNSALSENIRLFWK